jgi:hypothetical protein
VFFAMRAFPGLFLVVLIVLIAGAVPAGAQTATSSLSANLGTIAKLSLSSNGVSFPDADPDAVPLIPAGGGAIAITAKARARVAETVTLTVLAADDLRSGLDTIPAAALTWTASGSGFVDGTVSRTTSQIVGSWSGSGVRAGTQTFRFANSWTYRTGTYSVSLLYTLVSP